MAILFNIANLQISLVHCINKYLLSIICVVYLLKENA